jgi:hypothetical protein
VPRCPFNSVDIAEGSGKAAILDPLEALGIVNATDLEPSRALLESVVSMLTKLRKT